MICSQKGQSTTSAHAATAWKRGHTQSHRPEKVWDRQGWTQGWEDPSVPSQPSISPALCCGCQVPWPSIRLGEEGRWGRRSCTGTTPSRSPLDPANGQTQIPLEAKKGWIRLPQGSVKQLLPRVLPHGTSSVLRASTGS